MLMRHLLFHSYSCPEKGEWKLVNRQSSGYITEYREDICYVTCDATCTVQRTLRPVEYR